MTTALGLVDDLPSDLCDVDSLRELNVLSEPLLLE